MTKNFLDIFKNIYIAYILGCQDIQSRYRRSTIGPFWLTISMGVTVSIIAFVFGHLFNTPLEEYLPFLASGLILWIFFTSSILEGSLCFIESESMIKELDISFITYVLRVLWRNLLILAHNIVIIPFVFLFTGKDFTLFILLVVPGLFFVTFFLGWVSILLAIICSRYRDVHQIISSLLNVIFYLTPILWIPSQLSIHAELTFINLNPFYHMLELIRSPLLGKLPTAANYIIVFFINILGFLLTYKIFIRFRNKIIYWL